MGHGPLMDYVAESRRWCAEVMRGEELPNEGERAAEKEEVQKRWHTSENKSHHTKCYNIIYYYRIY